MSSELSKELMQFIDENIHSVNELQVLLFLHQHADRDWDADDIARQLELAPEAVQNHLLSLYLKGLLGRQDHKARFHSYRYGSPKIKGKYVSELAAIFPRARAVVVDYIFSRRKGALHAFSDAFNLFGRSHSDDDQGGKK